MFQVITLLSSELQTCRSVHLNRSDETYQTAATGASEGGSETEHGVGGQQPPEEESRAGGAPHGLPFQAAK